jgi:methyl-accepting chemotaxis protein
MRISQKLPLFISGCVLISQVVTGMWTYSQTYDSALQDMQTSVVGIREEKAQSLKDYLESIREDLVLTAESENTIQALRRLNDGWHALDGQNHTQYLQRWYPKNSNKELTQAADGSAYSLIHGDIHPWFRDLQTQRGYYDVFLIDLQGNVVYTVFKEPDFSTNLVSGPWKDSDLGVVFRKARQAAKGEAFLSDFNSYAPSNGVAASFIATPVFDAQGNRLGVLAFQMPVDRLNSLMNSKALKGIGHAYLVGADKKLRTNSPLTEPNDILTTVADTVTVNKAFKGESGAQFTMGFRKVEVYSSYQPFEFMGVRYALMTDVTKAHALATAHEIRNSTFIAIGVGTLLFSILGILYARALSRRIGGLNQAMGRLAEGDIGVEVSYTTQIDEIGDMGRALEIFKQNAIRTREMEAEQAASKLRAEEEKKQAMQALAARFESRVQGIINSVASAATELYQTAETMSHTIATASQKADAVATASTETSHNVQSVASATDEMTASVREITEQVSKSSRVVQEAVEKVRLADATSQSLEQSAQQIGSVVEMIQDIAGQINLLALNATIESARAGEAGKGFAVVATEVKNLAGQTGQATDQIARQIASIQGVSREVITTLVAIKAAIDHINEYSAAISAAIEEQSAVTGEIASNMGSAALKTQTISTNIEEVTGSASEASFSASQVLDAARALSTEAETLRREVDQFLSEVRTD